MTHIQKLRSLCTHMQTYCTQYSHFSDNFSNFNFKPRGYNGPAGVILPSQVSSTLHLHSLTNSARVILSCCIANFCPKQALLPPWKLMKEPLELARRYRWLISSFVVPQRCGLKSSASSPQNSVSRFAEGTGILLPSTTGVVVRRLISCEIGGNMRKDS